MATLAGMTVNERIAATGRQEAWDAAVRAGDRDAMIALLRRIAVASPGNVADAVLADPEFYGYPKR